jgi:hypothetical protein
MYTGGYVHINVIRILIMFNKFLSYLHSNMCNIPLSDTTWATGYDLKHITYL